MSAAFISKGKNGNDSVCCKGFLRAVTKCFLGISCSQEENNRDACVLMKMWGGHTIPTNTTLKKRISNDDVFWRSGLMLYFRECFLMPTLTCVKCYIIHFLHLDFYIFPNLYCSLYVSHLWLLRTFELDLSPPSGVWIWVKWALKTLAYILSIYTVSAHTNFVSINPLSSPFNSSLEPFHLCAHGHPPVTRRVRSRQTARLLCHINSWCMLEISTTLGSNSEDGSGFG